MLKRKIVEKRGKKPKSPMLHKPQSNKMKKLTENASFFGVWFVFFF